MDTDAISTTDLKSNAGRKPKGSGRRNVTTLSAEQLARKRAADRASQRVLRQRTRERIEGLENRIKELIAAADDNIALKIAERRSLELEEELRRLRAVYESLETGITPDSIQAILSDLNTVPDPIIQAPVLPWDLPAHNSITSPSRTIPVPICTPASTQLTSTSPCLEIDTSSDGMVPDGTTTEGNRWMALNVINSQCAQKHVPAHDFKKGTKPPRQFKDCRDKANTARLAPNSLCIKPQTKSTIQTFFMKQPSVHPWEIPLAVRSPGNPIDTILYGMVQQQRALSREGFTGEELAGPRMPSLIALLAPEHSRPVHTVARVISELLSRITYRTLVDKLGAFMVMYPIYQWLIMQSYETYCNLPSWLIPVLSQRTIPHPVWISGLGHPKLREIVIANQERYTTEEFKFLFVSCLNVNWLHGVEAALSWKDGDVTVSKQFWDHTMDLANWSLDEPFQSRYPELRGFCPFTEYPETGTKRHRT